NTAVREAQVARLGRIRAARDAGKVEQSLAALRRCAETGEGNLLGLAVEAARARATVGEISQALEKVWGRYQAEIRSISGVYGGHFRADAGWTAVPPGDGWIRRERAPPPPRPG